MLDVRGSAPPIRRLGLDAESLSGPEWHPEIQSRLAVSFAFGTADDVQYIQSHDMTAGVFDPLNLEDVAGAVSEPDVVVVAHNANYDLDLLSGVLLDHGLKPLPRIRYQDTMNDLKTGRAFRNKLATRCKAMGVNLKSGSPDWRAVLQRKPDAWLLMRDYNINDVVCTLQLERAYAARNLHCPIKTWSPRRGRR